MKAPFTFPCKSELYAFFLKINNIKYILNMHSVNCLKVFSLNSMTLISTEILILVLSIQLIIKWFSGRLTLTVLFCFLNPLTVRENGI